MCATSAKREAEIEEIARWALAVVEYLARQDGELAARLTEVIDATRARKSLAGMRSIRRDLLEMFASATGDDKRTLDELLRTRTGTGFDTAMSQVSKLVARVAKRGRVASETEYRTLLIRLEELEGDPSRAEEAKQIQELLGRFKRK